MPTTTSASSAKCAAPATTAPATVAAPGTVASIAKAGGSAAAADFLAMLGQMLQGAPEEAGTLAVEAVSVEAPDSGDDADDTTDPASLADQVLALASLSLPAATAPVPAVPAASSAVIGEAEAGALAASPPALPRASLTLAAAPAAEQSDEAPADGAESLLTGRGHADSRRYKAMLLDLAGFVPDAGDALAAPDAATALAARVDSSATQALTNSAPQTTTTVAGQVSTQVITQPAPNPFVTADAPPDPVLQRVVHASVGTTAWANELGTRLTIMAGQGQHSASLRLSPEHLGPLEVRIDMNDDKASVFFGAQHADTRAALNEALPRLRELFAASGMTLADSGVSQQAPRQESRDNAARIARALNADSPVGGVRGSASVTTITNPGLLDLYA